MYRQIYYPSCKVMCVYMVDLVFNFFLLRDWVPHFRNGKRGLDNWIDIESRYHTCHCHVLFILYKINILEYFTCISKTFLFGSALMALWKEFQIFKPRLKETHLEMGFCYFGEFIIFKHLNHKFISSFRTLVRIICIVFIFISYFPPSL